MRPVRCLMLLVMLLVIAGCRDHQEKLPEELSKVLGLDRPLEVLLVSPQGETSGPGDYASITVVFNQPMKALSAEAAPIARPFHLEPKVGGVFRWKGTATVSFIPSEPLPFGTEYKVTVPAGLTAASGKTLGEDKTVSFSTPGPRLLASRPAHNSQDHAREQPIVLLFDQEVDPAKIGPLLHFTQPGDAPKPTVRASTEAEVEELNAKRSANDPLFVTGHTVVLETQPLEQGVSYTLKLDKGLVGQAGPKASSQESVITFSTLPTLAWKGEVKTEDADPDVGVQFRFSTSVDLKTLKANLNFSPAVDLEPHDYDAEVQIEDPVLDVVLQPNTTYKITVGQELTDIFGQKLGQDVVLTWSTGDRGPQAVMADGIGVLEAGGKLSIPMGLLNIDQQTIRLARIETDEMIRLAARDSYDWLFSDKPWRPNSGFGVTKTVTPKGPRNERYDEALDLRPVLQGKRYGFVYYEIESRGARDFVTTHRGLAQITNLGASAKFSPEASLFMATSLDKAKPLADVEAVVSDGSGRPVWKGKTGADGRVEAPGWSQVLGASRGESYQDAPLTLLLRQGEDQVFVRNGSFGTVWTWGFDISTTYGSSTHQLRAQAYTERGLYTPGDEVQLKGAVRDRLQGRWVKGGIETLDFELFNSRDESMQKGQVKVSEFGTFHHTIAVPENSPTGHYRVDYTLSETLAKSWGVDRHLTGVSFRVEEFQPADFKVEVTSTQNSVAMGQTVNLDFSARWLFGTPMAGEKLTWSGYLEPEVYSHQDYPGFDFGPLPLDDNEDSDTHQTVISDEGLTDKNGGFQAQLPLKGAAFQGDARLTVEGTVTSSHRRSVTGRLVLPVARGDFRIGLRPTSRFVEAEQPVSIETVALSLDGKPVGGKTLKVELLRRKWNSVKKSGVTGAFDWVTEVEDQTVETREFRSGTGPTDIELKPKEAGYHVVRVSSGDGSGNTVLSETSFYAEGSAYTAWGREEGDRMELVADKPSYQPGETARILVKSPYEEATALITYERDTILHSYTTTLKGSSPILEVPLTDRHLPNLYVSVILLRGRVAADAERPELDTGKPAFKIGYIDLPVSAESQRLKVEMKNDKEQYGPGDEVVTTLKVTDSEGKPVKAELSVAAVDVGVLNLIDYQTPDFFETFHGSLPLAVRTAESRTDVIGQRSYGAKGESQGGGGGYNLGFRSDFRSTALWEPQVLTSAGGTAEVRFRLPENLTTFRVMATAIDLETRCGRAEAELVVRKPLMLKASSPSFARVGDELRIGVVAVNGTDKGQSLKVEVKAEGIEGEFAPREIFLQAGEEREVLFEMKASREGTAELTFSGQLGEHKDGLVVTLPIQLATQKVNLASSGQTTESAHTEVVTIPETAVVGTAKLEVSLAPTVLGSLQSSIDELLSYPYDCLEQRLSRMLPILFTDDLARRFGVEGWHDGKAKANLQASLDRLPSYASKSGGLKTWPEAQEANPYLTALAVRTAQLAEERGYNVHDGWLTKAHSYLKGYLDRPDNGLLDFSEAETLVARAAALEALSRRGFEGRSYLNSLMDRRASMPVLGKAYLLEAAHRLGAKDSVELLSTELTNALKVENATAYFDVDESAAPWLYSSDVRDTALVLAALMSTGQKLPVADKVVAWLLQARDASGSWGSTAANAAALSALWEYAEVFEGKTIPSFQAAVSLGGTSLGDEVTFGVKKLASLPWKGDLSAGDNKVLISKNGQGRLYYNVSGSYFDSQELPAQDQGMTVVRALMDQNGKPVEGALQGGQIYKVGLSVIAPAERRFVVLKDPVPAGFEVVKSDFATESSQLSDLLKGGSQGSFRTFLRFESYSEKVLLFADVLAPGEHYYEYLVRAQTPGSYQHPGALAEEMYHPELFGRSETGRVTITP